MPTLSEKQPKAILKEVPESEGKTGSGAPPLVPVAGKRCLFAIALCCVFICNINAAGRLFSVEQTPPSAKAVEKITLYLLAAGKSEEAENVLSGHLKQLPSFMEIIAHFQKDRKKEAKELIDKHIDVYRENQRIVFLFAACHRSRFICRETAPFFMLVGATDGKTAVGQCAMLIVFLDFSPQARTSPRFYFENFEKLVNDNPDDIALRWMLAVLCRTYDRNERGVFHCKKIVEAWKPGPVLVRQTYANMLDGLKRYEEALVERRKAVELEPAGWSYDGLGNTLDNLGRFVEAEEAHSMAVKFAPNSGHHIVNWAHSLMLNKKYDEAIKKCEQAVAIDLNNPHVWRIWGECLEAKGDKAEAINKYRQALELEPRLRFLNGRIKTLGGEKDGAVRKWKAVTPPMDLDGRK